MGTDRLVDDGEAEFEAFFDEAFALAFGLARRLIDIPADAEDIALEAVSRAYADWPKLRFAPYRRAWVARVTTNLVIGRARRPRRPLDASGATVDFAEATVVRAALVSALRSLSRRQRDAVALRFLADLSETETAEAMGVSAGAVKTHVHRGLGALRSILGADFGMEGEVRVR